MTDYIEITAKGKTYSVPTWHWYWIKTMLEQLEDG